MKALPLALFVLTVALGVGKWLELEGQEVEQAKITTQQKAQSVRQNLNLHINEMGRAVERMADRVKVRGEVDKKYWVPDARGYLDDFSEIKAVEWISKDLVIEHIEPLEGNEAAMGLNLTFEPKREQAVERASVYGETAISQNIDFVQGGNGFLLYAPVFTDGELFGMSLAVCDMEKTLDLVLGETRDDFEITIYEGGKTIYSHGKLRQEEVDIESRVEAEFYGANWVISMIPHEATLIGWRTNLPEQVLGGFILVAFLIGFGFWQLNRALELGQKEKGTRAFLETVSNNSSVLIFGVNSHTGWLSYINGVADKEFGLVKGEVAADTIARLIHPEDLEYWHGQIREVEGGGGDGTLFEVRLRNADGQWNWVEFKIQVLPQRDGDDGNEYIVIGYDLTERKANEKSAEQNLRTLNNIIDTSATGMALVSPEGKWVRVNAAICSFLGYTEKELLAIDFQTITHHEDLDKDLNLVMEVLEGKRKTYSMEKRYIRKDGEIVWAMLSVSLSRNANGEPVCFISQVHDINEMKLRQEAQMVEAQELRDHAGELAQRNDELNTLATVDGLTQVYNRRYFDHRLTNLFERRAEVGGDLGLVMVDVDHFKKLNDTHGHKVGDDVLVDLGALLNEEVRAENTVARYGGEEFVVLCPAMSGEQMTFLAQRLRKVIEDTELGGMRITASFGVAWVEHGIESVEELSLAADMALYRAKELGRNRVCTADELPDGIDLADEA